MNLDDYVSAMTVGMVRSPGKRAAGLAVLARGFELERPCEPEVRSLAMRRTDGTLVGFRAWLESMSGAQRAGIGTMHLERGGLAPHIAEAFSGANTHAVVVDGRAFVLEIMRSRSYAMSSADFVAWVRMQPASDAALLRVAAFVSDSNLLNGRKAVPAGEVFAYLVSPEGEQTYDMFASELVREVQLTVRNSGRTLVKPDNGWFATSPDLDSAFGSVPHDEQLELLGPVTADDLTIIFNAQAGRNEIWDAVRAKLAEMQMDEDLRKVPFDELGMVHRVLLGEMQLVCRALGVEVARPTALADRLGTHVDHMSENERAEFLPASEHLTLAVNTHAWECWCFRDTGPYASNEDVADITIASSELGVALDAIADFARRMKSDFVEAFEVAAWVLRSHDALELLSPARRATQLRALSERAREALEQRLPICDDLASVGFEPPQLRALLACELASVFGGMGSWNDRVPPEAFAAEHEALSTRLFACLERLRSAIV